MQFQHIIRHSQRQRLLSLRNSLPELSKGLPKGPGKEKLEGHKVKYAKKTPPKEYRETGATGKEDYADPANHKYPIHTEKNVKAAMSYFGNPANRKTYTPEQQKSVWKRIIRAAKRFKIEVSDATMKEAGMKKSKVIDAFNDAVEELRKSGYLGNMSSYRGNTVANEEKKHGVYVDESDLKDKIKLSNTINQCKGDYFTSGGKKLMVGQTVFVDDNGKEWSGVVVGGTGKKLSNGPAYVVVFDTKDGCGFKVSAANLYIESQQKKVTQNNVSSRESLSIRHQNQKGF